jgi:DNA helicase-2/ATP-dependent DNA helicase PcrA
MKLSLSEEKGKILNHILEKPKPLSEEKKKIVVTNSKYVRIVAGAGAGKTETLTRRIAYLLLVSDVQPSEIVAFTFTERAAQSMKSRIYQRVKELGGEEICAKLGEMYIGTIHGYCLRIIQDKFEYSNYDAMDENQEMAFLMREGWSMGLGKHGSYSKNCARFLSSAAVVYNELIDRKELAAKTPDFAKHLQKYESMLDAHKLLTFNQMIDIAVKKIEEKPAVLSDCKFLIVDEYQDINHAQEKLIRLIGKNASVFIVGDPRQSIYQWRGSDESCFKKFSKIFKECEEVEITENRRSTQKIIEIANAFSHTLSVKYTDMKKVRHEDGGVLLIECNTPESEAEWICKQIKKQVETKKACNYSDIALLFRSVSTSAKPFTEEFRKNDIPYIVGGRLGLFQREEAKALGMFFSWLWDDGFWYENKYSGAKINSVDLLEKAIENWEFAIKDAKIKVSEAQIINWKRNVLTEKFKTFTKAFQELLIVLNFKKLDPEDKLQAVVMANVGRFNNILTDYEASVRLGGNYLQWEKHVKGLCWYLNSYAVESYEEQPAENFRTTNAVQILTIHQAKGLEWPIVFVPSMVYMRFPSSNAGKPFESEVPTELFDAARYSGGEEEERRMFYVAITRPKELLCLSHFITMNERLRKKSKFLEEINDHLYAITEKASLNEVKIEKKNEEDDIQTFSPSQVIGYNKCPYFYRLRENWGYQAQIDPAIGYGKSLHYCLHEVGQLLCEGKTVNDAVESAIIDKFHIPYAHKELKERMSATATKTLKEFTNKYKTDLLNIEEVEARLEFPLQNANIAGRVDVIIRGNMQGELEVRDYKSSEEVTTDDESAFQVRLYTLGLQKIGRKATSASVAILDEAKIRPESEVERKRFVSKDLLNDTEKYATQTIDKIKKGVFNPKRSEFCKKCDYNAICRAI